MSRATATQRRTLAAIANGAQLTASRLYPYSLHEYKLNIPGSEGTPAKEQKLGLPTVASLVSFGWLCSCISDPKKLGDTLGYELTDAGRAVAEEVPA